MQIKIMYSYAQSPLLKALRMLYFIYWVMFYFIYWILFSQSKGRWLFFVRHHIVEWLKTSSRFGSSSSGWLSQKDVRAPQRGPPSKNRRKSTFYNKQIRSWLFFLGGRRLCWAVRYAWLLRTSPSSLTPFRVATDKPALKAPEQRVSGVTNVWFVWS